MNSSDLAALDACGAGALIAAGQLTSTDLVRYTQEAVARVDPQLRAVLEIYADAIRIAPSGRPPPGASPLWGVPILRKDLMAFESGRLCENGSELSHGRVARLDSELFLRLRRAGIPCIGRSATPELGYSTGTSSRLAGITRNPYDPERSPGGSSGGAAAAVASGMVLLAHGSDTGGSIRTPAGWTGLVGLKPTRGRVPEAPAPQFPSIGMTASFGLTRSVRDTAALLDALQAQHSAASYIEEVTRPSRRLRIGLLTRAFGDQRIDGETSATVARAAAVLESMRHAVEPLDIRLDWEPFLVAVNDVWTAHLARDCDEISRETARDPRSGVLQRTIRNCYEFGKRVTGTELVAAIEVYAEVSRAVEAAFERVDVLVTPTSTQLPPLCSELDADEPERSALDWARHSFDLETFMVPFNVSGHPAISLPLGMSRTGLPIGVQLVARPHREDVLLRLAGALEQALPWKHIRPKITV